MSQGMCKSGDLETPWQEKQIASAVDQPSDVQCDDPTYSCPDETTCCKQGDEYACCPMPKVSTCHSNQIFRECNKVSVSFV